MGRSLRSSIPVSDDVFVICGFVLLSLFTIIGPIGQESFLRIILGVLFVTVLPGYSLVLALFPNYGQESTSGDKGRINRVERAALSLGTSIVIVGTIGYVLSLTVGLRPVPLSLSVGTFSIVVAGVAEWRRSQPFRVEKGGKILNGLQPNGGAELVVTLALIGSVLAIGGGAAYTLASDDPTNFTEFYLLAEDNGQPVAEGYPDDLSREQQTTLYVGIENQEGEVVNYTVLVLLQRIGSAENNRSVLKEQRIDQFSVSMNPGARRLIEHEVTGGLSGDRLRLTYLLYRGDPPQNPTIDNAYREVHLWVNSSTQNQTARLDWTGRNDFVKSGSEIEPGTKSMNRPRPSIINRYTPA